MKNEITIPSMGESISEVIIGQILAPEGTIVKADAEILELETDKVNQALYALQAGRIHLSVKTGDNVKIGQVIGHIESVSEAKSEAVQSVVPSSLQKESMETPPKPISQPKKQIEKSLRYNKDEFLVDLKGASETETVISAQPVAPLKMEQLPSEKSSSIAPSGLPSLAKETRRPMSRIRKVIAQRLVEAQRTMAMLTTFNEVDLTHIIQLREKYKDFFAKKYGCKLGFMSFFIKAAVSALKTYPELNSYIDGDEIVHRETYDIGVAVGTEKGVIVPVIRNCNQLSYAEIEQALENFAKKAREGKLTANDLQGGGFTITNGGVYGSLLSTPILLPPQCGILGMHKIEKRPVVLDDQIIIRSMMYLALSYDHRLIDGKQAVSFLVHMKNTLEDSSRLLLDI